jgi:phosphoribosylformylglycinamidine synthase
MGQRLVRACHDCSEGGLAVAAAEMAFAGGVGATLRLADLPCAEDGVGDITALFGETAGRFLVEVAEADGEAFEAVMRGVACACVGHTEGDVLRVLGTESQVVIEMGIEVLKAAWQGGTYVDR